MHKAIFRKVLTTEVKMFRHRRVFSLHFKQPSSKKLYSIVCRKRMPRQFWTFGLITSVNTSISNAVPYHDFHNKLSPDERPALQKQAKKTVHRSKGHTSVCWGDFIWPESLTRVGSTVLTAIVSLFFRPPDEHKNSDWPDLMNYLIHPSDWSASCHWKLQRSSQIYNQQGG